MIRLARDETPFLSSMKLRAITLAWQLDDGNFIPLNIHDHDRSAHDGSSYPPTNPLIIFNHYSCGSPFSYREVFHCFLEGIPGRSI
jgi:hypothetical protein